MKEVDILAAEAAKKRRCLNCPLNKIDISQCTYLVRRACEWNYIRAFKKGHNQ